MRFLDRLPVSRRQIGYLVVVALAAWSVLATAGIAEPRDPWKIGKQTVHIEFPRAIGIYGGDTVLVQGVEAGAVEEVEPAADRVRVTVTVDGVALEPDARAALRLRSLLGERYIELGPVWDGDGPRLADGATVPMERTSVPMEISEMFRQTGELVEGIDPEPVRTLVHEFAVALEGRNEVIGEGLEDLAEVTGVLAGRSEEIDAGLQHLEGVVTTFAERDAELIDILEGTAVVAEALTAQEGALDAAIGGLDETLAEVRRFVSDQQDEIRAIFDHFDRAGRMLAAHADDYAIVVEQLPFLSHGFERAVQKEQDRWYVVNQPRGILFQPYGTQLNSGPGSPEWQPVPRIEHTEDSPLSGLVPYEVDGTEYFGPGPLLPSLRIGRDGAETIEHDERDDDDRPDDGQDDDRYDRIDDGEEDDNEDDDGDGGGDGR